MAKIIELSNVPNQEISTMLGGVPWTIRLVDCGSCTAIDITVDGEPLVYGQRIVADTPIFPYVHYWRIHGGLFLYTEDGDLPNWEKFNKSQWLFYFEPSELGM
jgi:hypothetical protein